MKFLLKVILFLIIQILLWNLIPVFCLVEAISPTFGALQPGPGTVAVSPPVQICTAAPPSEQEACLNCLVNKKGSWTVFGCLPHDPSAFAAFILRFSLGIGGGIAFLASILGGFYLLTSAGNPGRINQGKKIIFYSGLGLLIIIFSIFILQLVGVQILGIPGFGK